MVIYCPECEGPCKEDDVLCPQCGHRLAREFDRSEQPDEVLVMPDDLIDDAGEIGSPQDPAHGPPRRLVTELDYANQFNKSVQQSVGYLTFVAGMLVAVGVLVMLFGFAVALDRQDWELAILVLGSLVVIFTWAALINAMGTGLAILFRIEKKISLGLDRLNAGAVDERSN